MKLSRHGTLVFGDVNVSYWTLINHTGGTPGDIWGCLLHFWLSATYPCRNGSADRGVSMVRRKLFLGFLLSFMCGICSDYVWAAEDSALSILGDVVGREFAGDITARHGRVVFTDGTGSDVGDCDCSMPRESWDLDEEFVIVSTWDIASTRPISADKITIDVRYRVVGKSAMSAYDDVNRVPGRLQIISAPHQPYNEVVSYKLVHKKQGWMLVDPPAPRVSAKPVLVKLSDILTKANTEIDRARSQGDVKWEKIAQVHSLYVQSQINVLEYMTLP